nr:unnamed protein product [Callosobruchus chinensis]
MMMRSLLQPSQQSLEKLEMSEPRFWYKGISTICGMMPLLALGNMVKLQQLHHILNLQWIYCKCKRSTHHHNLQARPELRLWHHPITGPIALIKNSKSSHDIRVKFLNPLKGSIFNSSKNLLVSSLRRCRNGLTQQRGFALCFLLSKLHNMTHAAAQTNTFSSASMFTTECRALSKETCSCTKCAAQFV